jgi:hypothetical protein
MAKSEIINVLKQNLADTYAGLKAELDSFKDKNGDTPKSSAGDKHETSKAMADIEAEKLSQSLDRVKQQLHQLANIKPDLVSSKIGLGSLFKANNNWYFIAISYGKISTPSLSNVFVISTSAPIYKSFFGKKIGDIVLFNNISFKISDLV